MAVRDSALSNGRTGPFTLNALVAVIEATGQRAGRPRSDSSDEDGRTLLMFARAAACRTNFKKGARGRWRGPRQARRWARRPAGGPDAALPTNRQTQSTMASVM